MGDLISLLRSVVAKATREMAADGAAIPLHYQETPAQTPKVDDVPSPDPSADTKAKKQEESPLDGLLGLLSLVLLGAIATGIISGVEYTSAETHASSRSTVQALRCVLMQHTAC